MRFLPFLFFFFQAEDGIRDLYVTGVQTCALPIYENTNSAGADRGCRRLFRDCESAVYPLNAPPQTNLGSCDEQSHFLQAGPTSPTLRFAIRLCRPLRSYRARECPLD